MNATTFEAVASSKQGTILVVFGKLFWTNAPSNTAYNVSLSDPKIFTGRIPGK